jgi:6-phosphogluconolactonase
MENLRQKIFNNKAQLESALAKEISQTLEQEIKKNGKATLLVSGGSTPKKLYEILSNIGIDWTNVSIGLVDERFVATYNDESNELLIKNTLLKNKAAKAKFIGLVFNTKDYDENLNLAISENKPFYKSITCSILGMGLDGHTASLFPNSKEVYTDDIEYGNKMIINTKATSEPSNRISYTKAKILSSEHLFLYFNGKEKLDVFNSAKQNKNASIKPISAFINQKIKILNVFCSI